MHLDKKTYLALTPDFWERHFQVQLGAYNVESDNHFGVITIKHLERTW